MDTANIYTSVWNDGFAVRLHCARPIRRSELMELSFVFDLLRRAYGR